MKRKIGITGESGFVGQHLVRNLELDEDNFEIVPFRKEYFENLPNLQEWVKKCDVIVHFAALNRHEDPNVIYNENIRLVQVLIQALEKSNSRAHVIFSSSTQENEDNAYGKSKKEGRKLFEKWAQRENTIVNGIVVPNVFGPFGRPFYNSFIATFCHQLVNAQVPVVNVDSEVKLIYVQELIEEILQIIRKPQTVGLLEIKHTSEVKVSKVLDLLIGFKVLYLLNGEVPTLITAFETDLFNTFRSFIDHKKHFPVKLKKNIDARGAFVEIIRLGIGGQVSFSTTVPGVTRGNHFHTRKIERFTVIRGRALIQLRNVKEKEVLNFYLDGDEPAYVDMPIWYTHNIKNIGEEELLTIFWINEPYDPGNSDTYFVEV
ncbi:polysaccharide biosynthesis C-terminal domain-containing protein [Arcticibacterium luteifluviistationis]|uniref:Epimerase n=1 Tax=Arcticibacterium luteifluviistationis TaxID=1784714 RepID=A0A2Z4GEY0_9BACT|nr:NAD-dependent epimerase/dehydratase family protein [Arcticibacterium luteifluviistationis]AWV99846.1 epimerase [Arcticibacterium luteifluviistationis]